MTEDPRYPIYAATVHWTEDGDPGDWRGQRWWPTDPGPGRVWNSTSVQLMYKEDPGEEWVRNYLLTEWVPGYVEYHNKSSARDFRIREIRRYEESWCLEWFSHRTLDVGQSDEEALASFEQYVRRHEHYQDWEASEKPEGWICLMGAEDRWRWHGGNQPQEDRTPPPCRCEHCKRLGLIRINH